MDIKSIKKCDSLVQKNEKAFKMLIAMVITLVCLYIIQVFPFNVEEKLYANLAAVLIMPFINLCIAKLLKKLWLAVSASVVSVLIVTVLWAFTVKNYDYIWCFAAMFTLVPSLLACFAEYRSRVKKGRLASIIMLSAIHVTVVSTACFGIMDLHRYDLGAIPLVLAIMALFLLYLVAYGIFGTKKTYSILAPWAIFLVTQAVLFGALYLYNSVFPSQYYNIRTIAQIVFAHLNIYFYIGDFHIFFGIIAVAVTSVITKLILYARSRTAKKKETEEKDG